MSKRGLISRRVSRRTAALTGVAASVAACVFAIAVAQPELLVRLDGDFLRISAPRVDFLSGRALERLKSGVTVAFIGQLTVSVAPNALVADARSVARFALSYDIWEEKFAVTRFGERPEARRSISHLSAGATEHWCLDNLAIDQSLLPSDRPFYVQLDLRTEDPKDQLGILGEPGINITRLIEIFSRPVKSAQPRWLLNAGPFRVADLRKAGRG